MTTISDKALLSFSTNREAKMKLALHFKKHQNTIENWIKNRDAMLTTADAVRIISEETGIEADQVLQEYGSNIVSE